MARKRRVRINLQRASDTAQLRYGPEIRGLAELLREAQSNLKLNLRSEAGAAAGIQAGVKEALPEIRRAYGDAGKQQQTADADVAQALAGLGQGADPYRAVSASESGAAKSRLAEAMGQAVGDLGQRSVEAAAGAAYGARAARAEYGQERQKIAGQQRDLQDEMGLFASNEFRDLNDADAKLALERKRIKVTIRGQNETIRHNQVTEGETRRHNQVTETNDAKGKDGKSTLTPTQRRANHDAWDKAVSYAEALEKQGLLGPKTTEKVALALTKRGIPMLLAKAAIQRVLYGGVTKPTRVKVHRRYGLKPKVGHKTPYRPPVVEGLTG